MLVAVIMAMFMAAAAAIAMRVMGMIMGMVMLVAMVMGRRCGGGLLEMLVVMVMAMRMIMPAAAIGTMLVIMMGVIMLIVAMVVAVIMPVAMVIMPAMVIGAALRLEGPDDFLGEAALPAHHLRQHMIRPDIDRVGRDLCRGMAVADMPGDAGEAQRVLGGDLQQLLRRGAHGDKPAILQLERVAIADHRRPVEVEQQVETLLALQRDAALLAVVMIERHHVDDLLGLDGGFADDARGAQHGGLL
jgi:hypothetical protein